MVRSKPEAEVVCDAGPLIHLDELDCLDLLRDFSVLVPDVVWQEVGQHKPTVLQWLASRSIREKVLLPEEAGFKALIRAFSLDAGEQSALALMRLRPQAIFLTDDAAARLAAEQQGLRVHGTIGILLRAIRRAQRTPGEVLNLLHEIPQRSTLHIRPDLLDAITAKLHQEFDL